MKPYLIIEILLCIVIIQITRILSNLVQKYIKRYPKKFIKALLPKEALLHTDEGNVPTAVQSLSHGDIISISCGETVPLDCVLMEASATFEPASMFAASASHTLYEGDEVQGGLRMSSSGSVRLKVACPPEKSTFMKYANTYLNTASYFSGFSTTRLSGFFVNAVTACFKKGILISTPVKLNRLFNARLAIFTKEAILNTRKYKLIGIHPKNDTISEDTLLKYAMRAELPYDSSHIGHAILAADKNFAFLSDITKTEKYPNMGIKTITGGNTILAGNKHLMLSQNIKGLPVFDNFENDMTINDTYIYIAFNNQYMGYLHLTAPVRIQLADIIRFLGKRKIYAVLMTEDNCSLDSIYGLTNKKHRFRDIYTNQTANKKQENLLMLKQKYKFKGNDNILYFDKSQSDSVLTSMCDYRITTGPVLINQDISLADTSILSGNFISFSEGFTCLLKARKSIHLYTFINVFFILITFLSAICFPEVYFWHATTAACIMYLLINTLSVIPQN